MKLVINGFGSSDRNTVVMGHCSLRLGQNLDLRTGHVYPRRKGIVGLVEICPSKGAVMAKITM